MTPHPCIRLSMVCVLCAAALPAHAEPTRFDGPWKVVLTCAPQSDDTDGAKGYRQEFPGTVADGELSATYGTEGEPGWHVLQGAIRPDGSATLQLKGIVSNSRYAIRDAQRGKGYSYRVRAQFGEREGRGERLTGRACSFEFSR